MTVNVLDTTIDAGFVVLPAFLAIFLDGFETSTAAARLAGPMKVVWQLVDTCTSRPPAPSGALVVHREVTRRRFRELESDLQYRRRLEAASRPPPLAKRKK